MGLERHHQSSTATASLKFHPAAFRQLDAASCQKAAKGNTSRASDWAVSTPGGSSLPISRSGFVFNPFQICLITAAHVQLPKYWGRRRRRCSFHQAMLRNSGGERVPVLVFVCSPTTVCSDLETLQNQTCGREEVWGLQQRWRPHDFR